MKESVRPIEATALQHLSPKIHSPVTVVTAFNTIISIILKSVNAKLSKMKFVFVRRWRNLITEITTKEFPVSVASVMKIKTINSTTTWTVPGATDSSVLPSAIKRLRRVNQIAL